MGDRVGGRERQRTELYRKLWLAGTMLCTMWFSRSVLSLLKNIPTGIMGLRVILGAGGGWCEEVTKAVLC